MSLKPALRLALFLLACLSLPLCCLAPVALAPPFLFRGELEVVNQSGRAIAITPMGERAGRYAVLLRSFSRFPYLPLFKAGDLRLAPGESLRVTCAVDEDVTFLAIAMRDMASEYRQAPVPLTLLAVTDPATPPTVVIGPWQELPPIAPSALATAQEARRFNPTGGLRSWRAWVIVGLGLIPLGLWAAWLRLARRRP